MDIPITSIQGIFDQAAVGIAQIGLDGAWLLVNKRYCQMLGYSEDELRTKTLGDITHPDDCAEVLAGRRELLDGQISSHSMEKRYIRKDGSVFWGRLHRSLLRDENRLPRFFIAVVEDITQKVEAEHALRDSEQRLALATNAAGLGLWDCDLRTGITVISGEYARLHGLKLDHSRLTHEEWLGLIHPDDRERLQVLLRESIEITRIWEAEFRIVWPDGTIHWLLGKGQVYLDDFDQPIRMAGVSLEITERKRAEAALQESEERFRYLADTAPVMIWVVGPDKRGTFFNKCCLDFTGHTLEGKLGDGWIASLHPDDRGPFLDVYSSSIDAGQEFRSIFRLRRADGEYRWVLCTGVPRFAPGSAFTGYIGSCIDITDVKRAQEEALARQKLESLGMLANGIAHDFNNLLGGILASTEVALEVHAQGSPVEEELLTIRTACVRGAEIVRQLMVYGGNESTGFEPVDLSALVGELLELLRISISKHAILETNLDSDVPAVRANGAQIRQIVMNLVINASEAIGERNGKIGVTTSRVKVEPGSAVNGAANLPEGDYVRLEVCDTGSGMRPEVQARIFDPFYTTKAAGRGLGLAAVQGIVRGHGGILHVSSTPGHGSRFEVLLPSVDAPLAAAKDIVRPGSVRELRGAGGTVLVVEDEETLRISISKLLRKKGFSVIEAGDGTAGAGVFRRNEAKIDVVLLDVTLPGMSSREVLEELRRIRRDVKVILTSAFSQDTVFSLVDEQHPWGYLRKPYPLSELINLLQKACLEQSPA